MSIADWRMPEWRPSREREVYVDWTGRIIGMVKYSMLDGDYYAEKRGRCLGTYYDIASAKKAVEDAA